MNENDKSFGRKLGEEGLKSVIISMASVAGTVVAVAALSTYQSWKANRKTKNEVVADPTEE